MKTVLMKIGILLMLWMGVSSAMPADSKITLPSGKKVFISGMNLAWVNYGRDFADEPLDSNSFKYALQDIRSAGGNAVRVWIYPNGAYAPKFDATTGLVTGPGLYTQANLIKALDIAEGMGMLLVPALLSQNLGETNQIGVNWNNNKKLLTTDEGRSAFIQKAVIPMVKAIGKHPGLLCWEVFNEPEGMVSGNYPNGKEIGWVQERVDSTAIKIMVNAVAGAIHRAVPGILVSNGTQTFASNSTVDGNSNWYSDANLIATGGDADGILDFYMVHYYPWNGVEYSPFSHPASYWKLDKPVVIGEFPAGSWSAANANLPNGFHPIYDSANIDTLFQNLYNNGYAGALSWCYYGDTWDTWLGDFSTTAPSMSALYSAHKSDIMIKEYSKPTVSGNGALQMSYSNSDPSIWSAIKKDTTMDLSGYSKLSFDVLVPRSSMGTVNMHLVLKTGPTWEWDVSDTYCAPTADSTWMHCSADLASIHYYANQTKANLKEVHSVIVQFSTNSSFQGNIWFDNFKVDSKVLWDFDNSVNTIFSVDTYNPTEASKVTAMDVVFPQGATTGLIAEISDVQGMEIIRTNGQIQLLFKEIQSGILSVRDVQGKVVLSNSIINSQVLIPNLAEGALILEIRSNKGVVYHRIMNE